MKTKLILLGGVPGTGKTTIAYKLALKFKIDKVISTDLIKAFAKTYDFGFDRYVFTTTHEAYKLDDLSVVEGYLKHSKKINDMVLEVLNNIADNVIIVEGSTINKSFVDELDKDRYDIIYFNLSTSKNNLIKRYKLKETLRKSNWIDNINKIDEIANFLSNDNLNIVNNDLEKVVERITNDVKKILYI